MALGSYRFSLSTAAYQKLERTASYRWQAQGRAGRKPAQQYLGPDAEEIELDGTIYPHFKGGLGQIPAMKAEAKKGEPLILVDGRGKVWGEWCIKQIVEGQSEFLVNGVPRKIDFKLSLVEYGEDD